MAIYHCEHDDFYVLWEGKNKCPVCEKIDELEGSLSELQDMFDELKSEGGAVDV